MVLPLFRSRCLLRGLRPARIAVAGCGGTLMVSHTLTQHQRIAQQRQERGPRPLSYLMLLSASTRWHADALQVGGLPGPLGLDCCRFASCSSGGTGAGVGGEYVKAFEPACLMAL